MSGVATAQALAEISGQLAGLRQELRRIATALERIAQAQESDPLRALNDALASEMGVSQEQAEAWPRAGSWGPG